MGRQRKNSSRRTVAIGSVPRGLSRTLKRRRGLVQRASEGLTEDDFDPVELEAGTEVEMMEHGLHPDAARGIAMDHLAVDPDYYRGHRSAVRALTNAVRRRAKNPEPDWFDSFEEYKDFIEDHDLYGTKAFPGTFDVPTFRDEDGEIWEIRINRLDDSNVRSVSIFGLPSYTETETSVRSVWSLPEDVSYADLVLLGREHRQLNNLLYPRIREGPDTTFSGRKNNRVDFIIALLWLIIESLETVGAFEVSPYSSAGAAKVYEAIDDLGEKYRDLEISHSRFSLADAYYLDPSLFYKSADTPKLPSIIFSSNERQARIDIILIWFFNAIHQDIREGLVETTYKIAWKSDLLEIDE